MAEGEKAVLVGIDLSGTDDIDYTMEELARLATTAGAVIAATLVQKKEAPDRARFLGRGKVEELGALVDTVAAELVIVNDELSPTQIRNLNHLLGVRIVDRTALILDIFARRALSREGKLQVELAQMQYLLPRLVGLGSNLSRLGGGIGTRGPGETRLESDRRVIRRRIGDLKKEIRSIRKHRALHRERRRKNRANVVCLVGYTNAGKSTLLNALTGAAQLTEDKLFATLDPATRRGFVEGIEVLFTDTVGFISQLPSQLIAAFQATLEEIRAADVLLHVVELGRPGHLQRLQVVRSHLEKIDPAYHERELLVFNKSDLAGQEQDISYLAREYPGCVFASALRGDDFSTLEAGISALLQKRQKLIKVFLPYSEGRLYALLRERGRVRCVESKPGHLEVTALVDLELAGRLEPYTYPP